MVSSKASERNRDKVLEDSFPASDPPANSGVTGTGRPEKPSQEGMIEEKPTGTPTSDRHAAETAYHREGEETSDPKQIR